MLRRSVSAFLSALRLAVMMIAPAEIFSLSNACGRYSDSTSAALFRVDHAWRRARRE
jgi:hypothetical protein